jgi:hypothetical protein
VLFRPCTDRAQLALHFDHSSSVGSSSELYGGAAAARRLLSRSRSIDTKPCGDLTSGLPLIDPGAPGPAHGDPWRRVGSVRRRRGLVVIDHGRIVACNAIINCRLISLGPTLKMEARRVEVAHAVFFG